MKQPAHARITLWSFAFLLLALIAAWPAMAQTSSDYAAARQRWFDYLIGGSYNPADPEVAAAITRATEKVSNPTGTGYWDTIQTGASRTYLWSDAATASLPNISTSFSRLRDMSIALKMQGSPLYNNAQLRNDIVGGVDWLFANWYSTNTPVTGGYFLDIGIPLSTGDLFTLLHNDLNPATKAAYYTTVDHFMGTLDADDTGANLLDKVLAMSLRGISQENSAKITEAGNAMSAGFPYVSYAVWSNNDPYGSRDGFYIDGSFIQHNYAGYTGAYGATMLGGSARVLMLLQGSPWAITDPNSANVYKWVLDSFEPVTVNGLIMDMVRGRSIAIDGVSHALVGTVLLLAPNAPPDARDYFKSLAKQWLIEDQTLTGFYAEQPRISDILRIKNLMADSSVAPRGPLVLHQTFSVMDRVVHRRPNFVFGLSMNSRRTYNFENINGQNAKGYYTSAGMTYLFVNGDSFQFGAADGFWPTVNPMRLPGITTDGVVQPNNRVSSKAWAGGSEIGNANGPLYGAAGMDLNYPWSALGAKKSWFMFDDEIVALGAGITTTDNRAVETIAENRKLNAAGNNALVVNGATMPTTLGWSSNMALTRWANLAGATAADGVGYYFPWPVTIKGLREARTGAWRDIDPGQSATPLTRNYLSLAISHGIQPSNQSYAYALLPGMSSAQTQAYADNPEFQVLANTASVQAVRESTLGITAANFWQPGTVDFVRTSAPSSVTLQETGNQLTVGLSDPTMEQGMIYLDLARTGLSVVSTDPSVTVLQLAPTIRLRVDCSQTQGRTQTIRLHFDPSARPALPTSLAPNADSFTRGDAYANDNYGGLTYAVVEGSAVSAYARKTYLKFNVPAGAVTSAKLRISGRNSVDNTSVAVNAYGIASDTWSESGITWNNAPAPSTGVLGSFAVNATPAYYEVDVTPFVQGHGNDGTVSFALFEAGEVGKYLSFSTRESASNRPELVITLAPSVTVTPVADSFVRGGTYATDNYGGLSYLVVEDSSAPAYVRKGYLKFNLPAGTTTVSSARLRVYGNNTVDNASIPVKVYGVGNDTWTEGGLNWNNAPASGSVLATFNVNQVPAYADVDITAFVQSQIADGVASVALIDTGLEGKYLSFSSRESASNRPQLIIAP